MLNSYPLFWCSKQHKMTKCWSFGQKFTKNILSWIKGLQELEIRKCLPKLHFWGYHKRKLIAILVEDTPPLKRKKKKGSLPPRQKTKTNDDEFNQKQVNWILTLVTQNKRKIKKKSVKKLVCVCARNLQLLFLFQALKNIFIFHAVFRK